MKGEERATAAERIRERGTCRCRAKAGIRLVATTPRSPLGREAMEKAEVSTPREASQERKAVCVEGGRDGGERGYPRDGENRRREGEEEEEELSAAAVDGPLDAVERRRRRRRGRRAGVLWWHEGGIRSRPAIGWQVCLTSSPRARVVRVRKRNTRNIQFNEQIYCPRASPGCGRDHGVGKEVVVGSCGVVEEQRT